MVHVRRAEIADAKLLMELIAEMSHHERLRVFSTEEKLIEDGFGPRPKFQALIAEVDREVAGYALFFDCYSSFQGCGIFLEDLFVREEFRGKSVGSALLMHIGRMAVDQGCFGLMFNVLDWNKAALRFFEAAGASVLHERKTLFLSAAAIRGLDRTVARS